MKKEYKKPLAEVIEFVAEDAIMDILDDDDLPILPTDSVPDEW